MIIYMWVLLLAVSGFVLVKGLLSKKRMPIEVHTARVVIVCSVLLVLNVSAVREGFWASTASLGFGFLAMIGIVIGFRLRFKGEMV